MRKVSKTNPNKITSIDPSRKIKIIENIHYSHFRCENKNKSVVDEKQINDNCDDIFECLPVSEESNIIANISLSSLCFENKDEDNIIQDNKHNNDASGYFVDVKANELSKSLNIVPISEDLKEKQNQEQKFVLCRYCGNDIATLNFARHLQRKHAEEKEVIDIMEYPKNSKARRKAFALLRNDTNFDLYINGMLRPNRCQKDGDKDNLYYPCAHCKGLFMKTYLMRHAKFCIARTNTNGKEGKVNHVSDSQTAIACATDVTGTISKLNVKEQVFNLMRGDDIALEAKKDLLIVHFGESYLKKHKRERMVYACSNRMRELSRLLIAYRSLINNESVTLKEIFHPKNFDNVVSAARKISGYDPLTKKFTAASLSMHMGTTLKTVCDELSHLIVKETIGFRCKSIHETEERLKHIKQFRKLVESRWSIEISSLAIKDLQEKKWQKPLLVPLVGDVKLFRDESIKIANDCMTLFQDGKDSEESYKLLVNCSLSMLIIFNRRRIGDVQFLKINDYKYDKKTDFTDFESALTDGEKMLTQKYRRVINGGKGSRAVVILVPELIQNFIATLLEHRHKYIATDNEYVFALPRSNIKWGQGDVAIRTLAKKIKLKEPQSFSSNKLRKHIATIMQLLNLSQNEVKQFSNFMGHTLKTHEEFYEYIDVLSDNISSVPDVEIHTSATYASSSNFSASSQNQRKKQLIVDSELDGDGNNKDERVDCGSKIVLPKNSKSKTQALRKKWSTEEVNSLTKAFGSFIQKNTYPPADKIKEYMSKTGSERSLPIIKAKLQHIMNLGSK
ncbi:hypothetical protein FQR65_LT20025 [Abscondita terminalis]|nr:hypothetical protein FQR65_LT20025 [Abscondita terminalis]